MCKMASLYCNVVNGDEISSEMLSSKMYKCKRTDRSTPLINIDHASCSKIITCTIFEKTSVATL